MVQNYNILLKKTLLSPILTEKNIKFHITCQIVSQFVSLFFKKNTGTRFVYI